MAVRHKGGRMACIRRKAVGMDLRIPDALAAKAYRFPESSYGATTVTLILSGGRRIKNVVLGGGDVIVKIDGRTISAAADLDFSTSQIVDVVPQHGSRLRALIAAAFAGLRSLRRM